MLEKILSGSNDQLGNAVASSLGYSKNKTSFGSMLKTIVSPFAEDLKKPRKYTKKTGGLLGFKKGKKLQIKNRAFGPGSVGSAVIGANTNTTIPTNTGLPQQGGIQNGLGALAQIGGFGSINPLQGFIGGANGGNPYAAPFGGQTNAILPGTSFGNIPFQGPNNGFAFPQNNSQGGLIPLVLGPIIGLFTMLKSFVGIISVKRTLETAQPIASDYKSGYDQVKDYAAGLESEQGSFSEADDFEREEIAGDFSEAVHNLPANPDYF